MKTIAIVFASVAAVLLTVAMLFTAGWVHPPILSTQAGFRGVGMDQLKTPAETRLIEAANKLPDPIDKAPPGGDPATSVYQNVKVLNDLTVDQFNRVMLGLAAWVAPADQSCNYCHAADSMASDDLYTKRVARRMLQMTRQINKTWTSHVAATGVTCYTCHRGAPVPKYVWFRGTNPGAGGAATSNYGMGHPNAINGSTSMHTDPFTDELLGTKPIRVQSSQALPVGFGASIQDTERTYSLMMSISKSLGVNCTFCHNSREFRQWDGAPTQRVTAWYGLQLVRQLNFDYLEPLKAELPATRLGPLGDSPKVYCATCHQGVNKPLLGVSLAKDWPELGGAASN
jgi:photosynthetic reaction center cytochrome c subunit